MSPKFAQAFCTCANSTKKTKILMLKSMLNWLHTKNIIRKTTPEDMQLVPGGRPRATCSRAQEEEAVEPTLVKAAASRGWTTGHTLLQMCSILTGQVHQLHCWKVRSISDATGRVMICLFHAASFWGLRRTSGDLNTWKESPADCFGPRCN